MGANVNVFGKKIVKMRWIIIEFLNPVEFSNVGIAYYSASGKRNTSKEEEVIVQAQSAMNFELKYQANQCYTYGQAIEDTDKSLLAVSY